jgi:glutathione S-transferase
MSLILHAHPLSSFCQKVLVALYEQEVPFEFRLLDLADPVARDAHYLRWPRGKMPVLEDTARGALVPETSIIIEYLELHWPGALPLLPADPDERLQVRLWDRVCDLYVMSPMQRAVAARLSGSNAAFDAALSESVPELALAYGLLERQVAGHDWLAGDGFSMADCAAMPSLYYAAAVRPFDDHPGLLAYFRRLRARPACVRVFEEAAPWLQDFPLLERLPSEFAHPPA